MNIKCLVDSSQQSQMCSDKPVIFNYTMHCLEKRPINGFEFKENLNEDTFASRLLLSDY